MILKRGSWGNLQIIATQWRRLVFENNIPGSPNVYPIRGHPTLSMCVVRTGVALTGIGAMKIVIQWISTSPSLFLSWMTCTAGKNLQKEEEYKERLEEE